MRKKAGTGNGKRIKPFFIIKKQNKYIYFNLNLKTTKPKPAYQLQHQNKKYSVNNTLLN